jgi:hypothetical protein
MQYKNHNDALYSKVTKKIVVDLCAPSDNITELVNNSISSNMIYGLKLSALRTYNTANMEVTTNLANTSYNISNSTGNFAYYSYVVTTLDVLRKSLISQENNTTRLFTYLYNDNYDIRNDVMKISYNINNKLDDIINISNISYKINNIEININTLYKNQINIISNINDLKKTINNLSDNIKKINDKKKEEVVVKPQVKIKKEKPKNHLLNNIFKPIKDKFINVYNIFLDILNKTKDNIIDKVFYLDIFVNNEIQKIKEEQQRLLEEEKKIRERNKKIKEILNKR